MSIKSDRIMILDSAEDLFTQGKEMLRKAETAEKESEKRIYYDMARNYLEQGKKLTATIKAK